MTLTSQTSRLTALERWENLHDQRRFLPSYPSEVAVRYLFTSLANHIDAEQSRVLDLGCGGGRHSWLLATEGYTPYAIDFSLRGLHHARKRLRLEALPLIVAQADMHALPFANSTFHGIIAYGSLYYTDFPGMRRSVEELRRVLKKGHNALVVTRSKDDSRYNMGIELDSHTRFFDGNATNEIGMLNCFVSAPDLRTLFGRFAKISLDREITTLGDQQITNSNWIVVATK